MILEYSKRIPKGFCKGSGRLLEESGRILWISKDSKRILKGFGKHSERLLEESGRILEILEGC